MTVKKPHADSPASGPGPQRKSHFDSNMAAAAIWIYQGDFYVSARPDLYLTTVLGSCIAVCMRDTVTKCGGMNHFLLPDSEDRSDHSPSLALRYGSYSIERLINAIMSRGGRRDRLEVKVFGGAAVTASASTVGDRNVEFIEHYFAKERLPIRAADLRGTLPRKLRYFPTTGRAQVSFLQSAAAAQVASQERAACSTIPRIALYGSIDVFDDGGFNSP